MNKILNAINEQINAEMYSSYLYLSMAAHLDSISLTGFSNWMKIQAQEEMSHAMKFYHYIYERGGKVTMKNIEKPQTNFDSPLQIFEMALGHEKKITSLINDIYALAIEEKDYATQSFLKWFIDEQVEEESSASEIVDKIKLAGKEGPGLFMMDKELSGRTFTQPTENV